MIKKKYNVILYYTDLEYFSLILKSTSNYVA